MNIILVTLFFGLCLYTIKKLISTASTLWLMIGIIGSFSIGYYVLPILFQDEAGLSKFLSSDVTEVLLMSLLFFFFIIMGAIITENKLQNKKFSLFLNMIDGIFIRNYQVIYFIGLLIWLLYFFNTNLTSYAVEDSVAYFKQQSSTAGLIAFLSNFGMAGMAIGVAIIYKDQNTTKIKKILFFAIYLSLTILLLSTAQRLAVLKPIFMLVAAFYMFDNKKLSLRLILFGVLFLFIISPFMVFLREFDRKSATGQTMETLVKYKQTGNITSTAFQSIIDRADLLKVMIKLKKYFDRDFQQFNHEQYFYSLFTAFIPKLIYPDKPYPLSDTGTIKGEISVVAWKVHGLSSMGSLSAFGAISAYREGGYIWMLLNGFLVGFLFAVINKFLGSGGVTAKFLLVSLFVTLCVKNIPPSLSYFLMFIAPMVNFVIILYILNMILRRYRK